MSHFVGSLPASPSLTFSLCRTCARLRFLFGLPSEKVKEVESWWCCLWHPVYLLWNVCHDHSFLVNTVTFQDLHMCLLYLLVVRVCVASHHSVLQSTTESVLQCVAACCIVFQCVVACCNAWQNVSCLIVVSFRAQHTMCCNVLQCVAACCSVSNIRSRRDIWSWHGLEDSSNVCYSVLKCVAACYSVVQCERRCKQSVSPQSVSPKPMSFCEVILAFQWHLYIPQLSRC